MGPGQMDPVLREKSGGARSCHLSASDAARVPGGAGSFCGLRTQLVIFISALNTTAHLVKDICLDVNHFYGMGHYPGRLPGYRVPGAGPCSECGCGPSERRQYDSSMEEAGLVT